MSVRAALAVSLLLLLVGLWLVPREETIEARLILQTACRESCGARFRVRAGTHELAVHLRGLLPDSFGCDPRVRLTGFRRGAGFEAGVVVVRCPSKYRPGGCPSIPRC